MNLASRLCVNSRHIGGAAEVGKGVEMEAQVAQAAAALGLERVNQA
jgi:hypothetical protein